MPLPVITNVYRVAIGWSNTGSGIPATAVNVLHVRTASEDETGIANTLATAFGDNPDAWGFTSSQFRITSYAVTKLDGTSGAVVVPTSGAVGTGGADYLPQGSAVVSLSTGLRGPAHRGRIYMPALAENTQQYGLLDPTLYVAVAGEWDDVQTALGADGIELVVASYTHSSAASVVAITIHPFARTQRRRAKAS